MEIKGITESAWQEIVSEVSRNSYGGNVVTVGDEYQNGSRVCRARVKVNDSRGPGARRSWSGRRMPVACWHVYRDVLAELFERYPNAKVRTALAVYDGKHGFYSNYPATGDINIGSMVQPTTMPELCQCDGNTPITPSEYRAQFDRATHSHPRTRAINEEFGWDDSQTVKFS
jgi:hypothetical protein